MADPMSLNSGALPATWAEELPALGAPFDPKAASAGSGGRLIAVASGKGGVGKTVVSSCLATVLAEASPAGVVAIDVDLGGANLHNGLGVPRPQFALNRFVQEGTSLAELAVPSGIPGLSFIGGASDIVGLSEFSDADRQRFQNELGAFRSGTTVLDLGAGSSLFNLDLFCMADEGVLVTTPEPTAVQNAYSFLRAAIYRRIRLRFHGEQALQEMIDASMNHRGSHETASIPSLVREIARYNREAASRLQGLVSQMSVGVVVNMADRERASDVGERLARVVHEHLGVRLDLLGGVSRDDTVPRAICEWRPLPQGQSRTAPASHRRQDGRPPALERPCGASYPRIGEKLDLAVSVEE